MNNENIFKTKTEEELHKIYSEFLAAEKIGMFDPNSEIGKIKESYYVERYGCNATWVMQIELTHAICDLWHKEKDKERILSDTEVKTFERYIENNDMPTAFGNSDWCHIYRKIVGQHDDSEKLKNGWKRNERLISRISKGLNEDYNQMR